MNYIDKINQIHLEQIKVAEALVETTAELRELIGLHDFSAGFKTGDASAKEALESIKSAVTKSISAAILNETPSSEYESVYLKNLNNNINYYSDVHYYASLILAGLKDNLGKLPHNLNSYFSKDLSKHYLFQAHDFKRFSKSLFDTSDQWDFEKRVISLMAHPSLAYDDKPFSFFGIESRYQVKDIYHDMIAAQDKYPDELANFLYYDLKYRIDGRSRNMERDRVIEHGFSQALMLLHDRKDISVHDVHTLIQSGDIKPIKLWATEYYHDNLAPRVTDEGMKKVANLSQFETLISLKHLLSDREIL
jgi:hypothetical protein